MQLTKHFTLDEFTQSQNAERAGVDNTPNNEAIENLRALCVNVLEPLRVALNRPIIITSGYRNEAVNKLSGGSKRSQHKKGQAADIKVHGIPSFELAQVVDKSNLPFDQLIFEGSWVHISHVKVNRRMSLTAVFRRKKKTLYYPGIRET